MASCASCTGAATRFHKGLDQAFCGKAACITAYRDATGIYATHKSGKVLVPADSIVVAAIGASLSMAGDDGRALAALRYKENPAAGYLISADSAKAIATMLKAIGPKLGDKRKGDPMQPDPKRQDTAPLVPPHSLPPMSSSQAPVVSALPPVAASSSLPHLVPPPSLPPMSSSSQAPVVSALPPAAASSSPVSSSSSGPPSSLSAVQTPPVATPSSPPIQTSQMNEIARLQMSLNMAHAALIESRRANTELEEETSRMRKMLSELSMRNLASPDVDKLVPLDDLATLKRLDIHIKSRIPYPPDWSLLRNLRILNIYGTADLNALMFSGMTQLSFLEELAIVFDGSFNGILPSFICSLTSLRKLKVTRAGSLIVPGLIKQLRNLTELDLARNNIASLPMEIGELTNLVSLFLDANNLTSLPSEIAKLTNLKKLDLSGNMLSTLPDTIGAMTSLNDLNVSRNSILDLPDVFHSVPLESLTMFGNPLEEEYLPQSILSKSTLKVY